MKSKRVTDSIHTFDFFIQWHLTEKCNLACTHCYQEERGMVEMGMPEIKKTIGNISKTIRQWSDAYDISFSTSFNVTGGEPFLLKDFQKILQEISRYNFKIYVLTNGTMINREKAGMLADMQVQGVQVSLEGPEAVHEAIRGRGAFSSAIRGVEHLRDAGIPITLNVTLSEINADVFSDMALLAKDLGVQYLGFSRLVPYGRGFGLLASMLNKEKAKEVYEKIFSMETKGFQIVTGDPVASQLNCEAIEDIGEALPNGGCAAGVSGITLLPDGTISPCRRLGISIGNILKDSLREVWAASDVLNALRNKNAYKGKCRTCKRWSNCRGCRAIAYAYALSQGRNDFLEEDPQCFIE